MFSYSITRPYPFSWFTPVVVIGGLILTVVFTLLNLGSSVYSTKAIYTSDPNVTIGELNARYVAQFSGPSLARQQRMLVLTLRCHE